MTQIIQKTQMGPNRNSAIAELAELLNHIRFSDSHADCRESTLWSVYAHPWLRGDDSRSFDALISIVPRAEGPLTGQGFLVTAVDQSQVEWLPLRPSNQRGQIWVKDLRAGSFRARLGAEVKPDSNDRIIYSAHSIAAPMEDAPPSRMFRLPDRRVQALLEECNGQAVLTLHTRAVELEGTTFPFMLDTETGELTLTRIDATSFTARAELLQSFAEAVKCIPCFLPPCRVVRADGHPVTALSFAIDGEVLASAGLDGTVRLWDAATGALQETLPGHAGGAFCVGFSPDGQLLASGGEDGAVRLWDAAGANLRRELTGHEGAVRSLAFSPDGQMMFSGSANAMVRVWDVSSGNVVRTLAGHSTAVTALAASPDGTFVASGSADTTVRLWDTRMGTLTHTLGGHRGAVCALAVTPDARALFSGGEDKTICCWELPSGRLARALTAHAGAVRAVALSFNGKTLATAGADRDVKLWSVRSGELLQTLTGHGDDVTALAFAPGARGLASGSRDRTIRLWAADAPEPPVFDKD